MSDGATPARTDAPRRRMYLVAAWERPDGMTEITCFGPKRHFRKAGDCRCVADVLLAVSEDARSRVVVVPFGGDGR